MLVMKISSLGTSEASRASAISLSFYRSTHIHVRNPSRVSTMHGIAKALLADAYLVYTGCVNVPDATMQCAGYHSFQALSTGLERPEADCRQLYSVIELYRRRNARRLAHQVQSCSSRAAALCLDDHTSISPPSQSPQ